LATPVYGSSVTVVEPYALDRIDDRERHGHPRDLFALWFGANAETANFAVGILAVALFGASLQGAVLGLVAGSILGYAIVGLASCAGPKYGLPQMVFSRRVFGTDGNALPAIFAFLAGVGWFSIDTIFGAQAVAALLHVPYLVALVGLLIVQIAIAVYGYNAIHAFERVAGIASLLGFGTIAVVVLSRANLHAPFDAHAPLATGGAVGAVAFSASLAFAYSVGWAPSAADYSRYLPASSSPRAIVAWAFGGGFLPSTGLMILGAAAATVVRAPGIASATPADTMTLVAGGNATLAAIGLTTVLIGTLSGNVMNLYSGALSALVAYDPLRRLGFAALVGAALAALTVLFLLLAGAADPSARYGPLTIALAALAVGGLAFATVRWTLVRWQAALAVGLLGGVLALTGQDATATAHVYGNFLGLLSTWAAPWAGVVIGARATHERRIGASALVAWIAGIAAGLPFWQQSWFVGPIAATHPQLGDISYFVSFAVAYGVVRAIRSRK
jgi:NCS1 family nucleobase:cation symporter-1